MNGVEVTIHGVTRQVRCLPFHTYFRRLEEKDPHEQLSKDGALDFFFFCFVDYID